jgi:predicted HTH transcriptional regulator
MKNRLPIYYRNAGICYPQGSVPRYQDQSTSWNPGTLTSALTLQKLKEPHGSFPANPLLAEPLYLAKYIERMGTGTRDMIRLCNEAGLREPDFAIRDGFVQTLWRPLSKKQAQAEAQADLTPKEIILLTACSEAPALGQDLLAAAGYQRRTGNFKRSLEKLLTEEWLALTIPDKPTSPKQRYRLTTKGQALFEARKK